MRNTRVKILSDEVIGKISAGEVVERAASVVKELVENSIDAGAHSIDIEVEKAGQSLVRVADNGEGMSRQNAETACLQHATSKISGVEDLDNITTLGFRGEALASIASVSRMDLITRFQADETGTHIYLEDGRIKENRPIGRSRGTTVEVRDLFYNVPARRKFMKKEPTELAEIVSVTGRFILAYPGIEFKLTHGGRCLLRAEKDMKIAERIGLVLRGDISDNMASVSGYDGKYDIMGYVSRPASTRKDRRTQMFFINGRFVRSRLLSDAVGDAYRSLVERGRYPAAVLFLTVSPDEVDVNVHPTKLQVKFGNEKDLKKAVSSAIKKSFDRIKQTGREFQSGFAYSPDARSGFLKTPVESYSADRDLGPPERECPRPAGPVKEQKLNGSNEISDSQTEFDYEKTGNVEDLPVEKAVKPVRRNGGMSHTGYGDIFQVGGCYIVRIEPDVITITDQHAAHERVLYEFFSRISEDNPVEMQNLLFPVRVDLSPSEFIVMEKVIDKFKTLGFDGEPFGGRSFIVRAAPAVLKDRDIKTVVYDVLTDIASRSLARIDSIDEFVKLMSCRAAIKAGAALNGEEMTALLGQLAKCELPFTCPHGRPTTVTITIEELEKRFRRK